MDPVFFALPAIFCYVIIIIRHRTVLPLIKRKNIDLYRSILGTAEESWLERGGDMGGEDHKIGWHLHKAIFRGDLTGEFISAAQYKVYVTASWGLLIFGLSFAILALWSIFSVAL